MLVFQLTCAFKTFRKLDLLSGIKILSLVNFSNVVLSDFIFIFATFLSNAVHIEKCNVEKTWRTIGIRNHRRSHLDRISFFHLL